ncbi:MAG TPA: capsid cement protein [Acidothermaceae bacterium]
MAEYLPLHSPGQAFTRVASAAITAGNLLSVSGSGTVAPSAAADATVIGVAAFDTASGANVTVFAGGVQRLVAGTGGLTAGQFVHAGATGTVIAHTNGTTDYLIVGLALTTATATNLVEVLMVR